MELVKGFEHKISHFDGRVQPLGHTKFLNINVLAIVIKVSWGRSMLRWIKNYKSQWSILLINLTKWVGNFKLKRG